MYSMGDRLKEIREQMGLTKTQFAQLANVSVSSQTNYEEKSRVPSGEYLAALAEKGIDITYILTGKKTINTELSSEEAALVENYRATPEEKRSVVTEVSASFAQHLKLTKLPK